MESSIVVHGPDPPKKLLFGIIRGDKVWLCFLYSFMSLGCILMW